MKPKLPKLFNLTLNSEGVKLSYNNPNPLTDEQKYNIILTAFWLTAAVSVVAIVASAVA